MAKWNVDDYEWLQPGIVDSIWTYYVVNVKTNRDTENVWGNKEEIHLKD